MVSSISILCLSICVFVLTTLCTIQAKPDRSIRVTCGSIVKLRHRETGARLHSHKVSYGSGSGQQSVTGSPDRGDPNSYWTIKAAFGASCPPGKPVKHGDVIQLQHVATQHHLHSHLHRSPLSGQQEVSCFGGNDSGDDWLVEVLDTSKSKVLVQGAGLRLKHKDTGMYLHSHDHKFGNPIPGQHEVTAFKEKQNSDNVWTFEEGVFYPKNT